MADLRFFDRAGPFSLDVIADKIGAELLDSSTASIEIVDVAPLDTAGPGQIAFLDNSKYIASLPESNAAACILSAEHADKAPDGMALLVCQNPYKAYALTAAMFYPLAENPPRIDPTAVINPAAKISQTACIEANAVVEAGAEIGDRAIVGANSVIRRGVVIGDDSRIDANVTISHALIGKNVVVHAGAQIGVAGFGFAPDPSGHVKIPQLGRVIIDDGCDIGGNTVIDRGAGPDTVIGAGTFIDNLCQIAHNVKIGRGAILTAQNGISGSTEIGDFVVMGGNAGAAGHLKIGPGAQIAAKSAVMKDVPAGEVWAGYPARPIREWQKQTAAMRRLIKKKG